MPKGTKQRGVAKISASAEYLAAILYDIMSIAEVNNHIRPIDVRQAQERRKEYRWAVENFHVGCAALPGAICRAGLEFGQTSRDLLDEAASWHKQAQNTKAEAAKQKAAKKRTLRSVLVLKTYNKVSDRPIVLSDAVTPNWSMDWYLYKLVCEIVLLSERGSSIDKKKEYKLRMYARHLANAWFGNIKNKIKDAKDGIRKCIDDRKQNEENMLLAVQETKEFQGFVDMLAAFMVDAIVHKIHSDLPDDTPVWYSMIHARLRNLPLAYTLKRILLSRVKNEHAVCIILLFFYNLRRH